ncbi:MAG: hypothetical protein ACTHLY_10045, partial [Pseudolabrys sp.]
MHRMHTMRAGKDTAPSAFYSFQSLAVGFGLLGDLLMVSTRRVVVGFAAILGVMAGLLAPAAQAADWPSRPIRGSVPVGAGGGADVTSRIVAAELSKRLGTQVFIDN